MSVQIDGYPSTSPAAAPDATADWQAANQRRLLAALAGWDNAAGGLLVNRAASPPLFDPSQRVTIT